MTWKTVVRIVIEMRKSVNVNGVWNYPAVKENKLLGRTEHRYIMYYTQSLYISLGLFKLY